MTANNMYARVQAVTGDSTATLLFFRIRDLCRMPNGGAIIDGRKHSYHSVAEWGEEISVSLRQSERALKNLRERGLLTSVMAWAGKGAQKCWVLHVATTVKAERLVRGEDPQEGGSGCAKIGGGGTPDLAVPIYTMKPYHETHHETLGELSLASASGGAEKGAGEMKKLTSVNDLKQAQAAMNILHPKGKNSTLEAIWKAGVNKITGKFVSNLSGKDLGLLGDFRDKCPPGQGKAILAFVLDHWFTFVKQAQTLDGDKNLPDLPRVYFLWTHRDVAIMLFQSHQSPPKQEAQPAIFVSKPVQVTAQPAKVETPDTAKMSMAELLADPDEE